MARLRYVAYIARDADKLPRFYADHLGLSELGRSADGDVSVTDGYFNLTFLQLRSDLGETRLEPGLHHLGLEVDSIAKVREQDRHGNARSGGRKIDQIYRQRRRTERDHPRRRVATFHPVAPAAQESGL